MKQGSLISGKISHLSTCEWYQYEKESYALSSPYRPEVENTLNYSFRQTSFPSVIEPKT